MTETKLISVRMEKQVLQALDQVAKVTPYRTRSACINRILKCVLTCASEEAVAEIVDTHDPFSDGLQLLLRSSRHMYSR